MGFLELSSSLAPRKRCAAVGFRLPGPLGVLKTLRRRAFSLARATWRFENTAQACVFAWQGHLALRKHCAGVRFRLSGPLGASKTLRGRAFSLARATWRFKNIAQACVFACPGHLALRKHCADVRFRLPGPLGVSKTLRRRAFSLARAT